MSRPNNSLTQSELKRVLHYDPLTGVFTWRYRQDARPQWNGRFAGKKAGNKTLCNGRPYIKINLNGRLYYAQRLAFLYMTGEWPKGEADHIDSDSLHNAWANLRDATRSENVRNTRGYGKTGYKGVYPRKSGRFSAQIHHNRVKHNLGTYDTAEEAHDAYVKAARERYGEFHRG